MALFMGLCLLAWIPAQAQTKTISGKVTATDGSGLPGVNIILKGGTVGTVSDIEGNYRLSLPSATGKLVFSFVGYLAQTLDVPATGDLNVVLAEDLVGLEEVVITGLATNVKRSNLANAVTSISAKELIGTTSPVTTDGALQGKIAGANIQSNGSMPGGGFNIQFRGLSTLGGASQPLFIVDGVYIDNSQNSNGRSQANKATGGSAASTQDNNANRLADLNPDDIENIEILKGASAAAIYGTRANAGVVIITTKRGKGGKTKVNFGQDIGWSTPLSFMGGADWTEEKLTTYFSPNEIPALRAARQNGTYTDWERVVYGEVGQIRNTRLGVAGGDEKTKFYINGSMADETGIVKNTGFQRYSLRANIDHKFNKWIDLGVGSNYIQSNNDRGWVGNDNSYVNYGYSLPYTKPFYNLYPDAQGNYPDNQAGVGENPLAIRDRAVNNQKVTRFLQSFYVNLNAINKENMSLTFKLNGGLDYQNGYSLIYLPDDLQSQKREANPGFAQDTRSEVTNYNIQFAGVFTYAAMENKLNLTSSAGIVQLGTNRRESFVRGRGLPAGISNPGRAKAFEQDVILQNNTDQGFFAQQEANYEDKVIASVGIRFDRSTLNGDPNKWYAFPRASLAVNLANFNLFSKDVMSQLKLRVAYGQTAGLPVFGSLYSQLLNEGIGGQGGFRPSTILGNVNIRPETSTELEYGVDFSLFNGKIVGEVTLYNKKVFDLIQPLSTAPTTGVTSTSVNAADLENNGLELSLGAEVIKNENFSWFIQPIFWFNRSKITRLDIPARLSGGFGASFGQWRIMNGGSPTQIVGQPTTNAADINAWTVYGDQQPKFELSLNQRITFLKNFEFSMLAHYRHEFTVVSLARLLWDEGGNTSDWNSTGQDPKGESVNGIYRQNANGLDGDKPRPGYNPVLTSFLKLREVALYYRIPKPVLNKAFGNIVDGVKVGFSGNNLLRWTDYTAGYDPENSNFGSAAIGSGVDLGSMPAIRRMMFHLSVDF